MEKNYSKGKVGESVAIEYLKNLNYVILDINYSTNRGEIDIVALDREIVVFIEVKSRSTRDYGNASEAVDIHKQRKIINTSKVYLMSKGLWNMQVRYDVVEVYYGLNNEINHFENAFISE